MTQQEQRTEPQLRFSEFSGEWQEKRLGEVFERVTRKNIENNKNVLTISAQHGLINQEQFFNKSVAANNVTGYYLLHKNEFAYNKSYSKGYPMGAIKKLNKYDKGVVSTLYICFKAKPENHDIFFENYFDSGFLNKGLHKIAQEGARNHGLLNLSVIEFFRDINLFFPTPPEQKKIADFLSCVNRKIDLLNKKHDALKNYKKGIIQKIFSQEIRFKDDNGQDYPDWQEKALGEIAQRTVSKNKSRLISFVLTNSATQGIVSQKDYFDKDIANQNNLEGYYIARKNDFVYNPRISNDAPVGPIKRNHLCDGVMSPLYTVFSFHSGNLDFLEYFFFSSKWYRYLKSVANYGVRHDRMNISNDDLFKMPISFPIFSEQKKIADFLLSIDNKITSLEDKIKQAKLFKKALLQKMFI